MHPPHVRASVLELVDSGHNDCQIARVTGLPRSTVRDIRRYRDEPRHRGRQPTTITEICPRCWGRAKPIRFTPEDYSELLGLYLGDGCLTQHARTTRLRIALDAKYPRIIADAKALLERSLPENPVGLVEAHEGTMYFVSIYSSHLPCLFPQHGNGPNTSARSSSRRGSKSLSRALPGRSSGV
jgi:Homeodomain-like domain